MSCLFHTAWRVEFVGDLSAAFFRDVSFFALMPLVFLGGTYFFDFSRMGEESVYVHAGRRKIITRAFI